MLVQCAPVKEKTIISAPPAYGSMRYLLLIAVLMTGALSLLVNDGYSQHLSKNEVKRTVQERVQGLLSDQQHEEEAEGLIFELGESAIPSLVEALRDPRLAERASHALVALGGPEERKALLQTIRSEKNRERKWLISAYLAGALVEPSSKAEWDFLEICVKGHKDETKGFAATSAALALGMNGSTEALRLLQTAGPLDEDQIPDSEIGKAVRWIKQKAAAQAATSNEPRPDSEQIKQRVLENAFYAEGERESLSVRGIIFTENKNRALASVEIYHGPKDARVYEIVLQKSSGTWRITGTWMSFVA